MFFLVFTLSFNFQGDWILMSQRVSKSDVFLSLKRKGFWKKSCNFCQLSRHVLFVTVLWNSNLAICSLLQKNVNVFHSTSRCTKKQNRWSIMMNISYSFIMIATVLKFKKGKKKRGKEVELNLQKTGIIRVDHTWKGHPYFSGHNDGENLFFCTHPHHKTPQVLSPLGRKFANIKQAWKHTLMT